jgi:hypothetical protein
VLKEKDLGFAWWKVFPEEWDEECRARAPIFRLEKATLRELATRFVFGTLPDHERPLSLGNGLPAATKRNYSVRWRTRLPSAKEKEVLSRLVQGSPEWLDKRGEGIGGSEVGEITGASHYRSPHDTYCKHIGAVADAAKPPEECFNFDHGHAGEPWAALYYGIVMQPLAMVEAGIVAHPRYCFTQASPDRLLVMNPSVVHSEWTRFDAIKGNQEIKCPVFSVHVSTLVPDLPFFVPLEYCTQQQGQSDACESDWNDFTSLWRAGMKRAPVALPRVDTPAGLDACLPSWMSDTMSNWAAPTRRTPAGETYGAWVSATGCINDTDVPFLGKDGPALPLTYLTTTHPATFSSVIHSYLGSGWCAPRAYLVGQMHITRQYHSPTFCADMFAIVGAHVKRVQQHHKNSTATSHTPVAKPPQRMALPLVPVDESLADMALPRDDEKKETHPAGNALPAPEPDYDPHPLLKSQAQVQLLPLKKVDWVLHDTPRRPRYKHLFPRLATWYSKDTTRRALEDLVHAECFKGMFRQSCTVPFNWNRQWLRPTLPADSPGSRPLYLTVFVTSYPNMRPLGSDNGLSVTELDHYY